jgi:hypothetical protein
VVAQGRRLGRCEALSLLYAVPAALCRPLTALPQPWFGGWELTAVLWETTVRTPVAGDPMTPYLVILGGFVSLLGALFAVDGCSGWAGTVPVGGPCGGDGAGVMDRLVVGVGHLAVGGILFPRSLSESATATGRAGWSRDDHELLPSANQRLWTDLITVPARIARRSPASPIDCHSTGRIEMPSPAYSPRPTPHHETS